MTPTHYVGLSIGPIYDTITQARKTRELWLASYLFSHLMQELLGELSKAGFDILSPQEATVSGDRFGAGLYPDRLYATGNEEGLGQLEAAIGKAIGNAQEKLFNTVKPPEGFAGDAAAFNVKLLQEKFWERYFRIVHVAVPKAEIENGNVLGHLNDRLDTLELQPKFFAEEPEINGLLHLLVNPYQTTLARQGLKATSDDAYRDLTRDFGNLQRFPSTSEIASLQLHQLFPEAFEALRNLAKANISESDPDQASGEDDDVIQELYRLLYAVNGTPGDQFEALRNAAQPYHKYFCIVQADGDNFGKVIESLGSDHQAIRSFSEKLADFGITTAGIINDFGGKPIYIGGDDLVFFAPVVAQHRESNDPVTVFDCIAAIDEAFHALHLHAVAPSTGEKDKPEDRPKPSLSFGLTISYYKFPLFESYGLSYDQLFGRAKKLSWNGGGKPTKNSVAFRLLKHSGTYFEGVMNKQLPPKDPTQPMLFEKFLGLVAQFVTGQFNEDSQPDKFLSSFVFKLKELESVARALVDDQRGLDQFFQNFFNEPIHREFRDQLNEFNRFTNLVYQTQVILDGEEISRQDNFYSLLRLMEIMTAKNLTHHEQ
jgi:CRISPR-associated protein Cmr2